MPPPAPVTTATLPSSIPMAWTLTDPIRTRQAEKPQLRVGRRGELKGPADGNHQRVARADLDGICVASGRTAPDVAAAGHHVPDLLDRAVADRARDGARPE